VKGEGREVERDGTKLGEKKISPGKANIAFLK
jgi:hypothetical protein